MNARVKSDARRGQFDGARAPFEQRHAEIGFELLDLMTDGALRDEQFLRGVAETQEPGGGFESTQGE